MSLVQKSIVDGVATIEIARPPLNLLNWEVKDALRGAFDECAADDAVRAIVLASAGKVFCAGSDLKDLAAETGKPGAGRTRTLRHRDLFVSLTFVPKPTIAAIEGIAFGAGLELAIACDLRVAAVGARFAMPEVKTGAVASLGSTRLVWLVGEAKAKEMMFLAEEVAAEEALRVGLVNKVAPDGTALATAKAWAARIASFPATAVQATKRLALEAARQEFDLRVEPACDVMDRVLLSADLAEGMKAFFEKRPPRFPLS